MKNDTCCFTGHRNIRKADEENIKEKIREQALEMCSVRVDMVLLC